MKIKLLLSLTLFTAVTALNALAASPQKIELGGGGILHLYQPAKANGMAVVMCPGGGYDHLAINHEGHDMADWFNDREITYAVLQYRLPQMPCDTLPMTDAHKALDYLATNADRIGIKADKIGIMGASAGGNLASHIANTDNKVTFHILLYPVISLNNEIGHGGSRVNLLGKNPSKKIVESFSNENLVNPCSPPAFIVLSQDDKDVNPANSLLYFSRLTSNGVPAELHIFPDGGHGWGFRDSFPHKQQWLCALSAWLNKLQD